MIYLMARSRRKEKAAIFNAHVFISREIKRSRDAQCNPGELPTQGYPSHNPNWPLRTSLHAYRIHIDVCFYIYIWKKKQPTKMKTVRLIMLKAF